MKLTVEILPYKDMRYNTYGDYFYDKSNTLRFQIVDHSNDVYTKLTLIHELVEQLLLEVKGITPDDVDRFDFDFESDTNKTSIYSEPGEDPSCIYKKEHDFSDNIIKQICESIGIKFEDYINNSIEK
jgi:hypothetical protein